MVFGQKKMRRLTSETKKHIDLEKSILHLSTIKWRNYGKEYSGNNMLSSDMRSNNRSIFITDFVEESRYNIQFSHFCSIDSCEISHMLIY